MGGGGGGAIVEAGGGVNGSGCGGGGREVGGGVRSQHLCFMSVCLSDLRHDSCYFLGLPAGSGSTPGQ